MVTEGLDGLRERLAEYRGLGAKFAKWRAVIDIGEVHGMPSYTCVNANAHALARYAALCQDEGIVPIVEPEVLMDGDHDIDRCAEVTTWVLKETFQELFFNRVALEGMVLKPNMVVPGKKSRQARSVEEVAEKTLRVLKECVPAAVPGIAFLSGGQSDEEATAHLDAMNKMGAAAVARLVLLRPRAAAAPQKTWSGKSENVAAAQRAFSHRAMMNSLATLGQWKADLERKAAVTMRRRMARTAPRAHRGFISSPPLDDTAGVSVARARSGTRRRRYRRRPAAPRRRRRARADQPRQGGGARRAAPRHRAPARRPRPKSSARAGADGAHLTGIEAFTAALRYAQARPHRRRRRLAQPS